MEEFDFIVDTTATEDSEVLKTFNSPFPIFSSSKFTLKAEREAGESDEDEDSDEYFGKSRKFKKKCSNLIRFKFLGLPPPSIRIKDALERCPIKLEHFKSPASSDGGTARTFNDKLLNGLDDYLEELRPKKYSFVTDGIETKTDITKLGMTDNQLKKHNRVR